MSDENEKLIYYDNETGLHRANASEIKTALKSVVTEAYGDVLLDDNYPDGILINGLTEMIDSTFQTVETIYNMLDINSAEGVILDTIGNIRNEHRKPATYSDLKVRLTVTVETAPVADLDLTFVNNTLSLIDENNNYYYLTTDLTITIPAGETSAYGEGDFRPSNKGVLQEPTEVKIGAIDSNLPISSENITLLITKFTSGENDESDIAFRNRMNNYSVFNSVTIKENLNNELLDLSYIKDAKIYYNNSTLNLYPKGADPTDPAETLKVPPAYMYVLIKSDIDFDTDTDKRQEVFDTIESYKGLGTLCWLPDPEDVTIGKNYISQSGDPAVSDGISQFLVPAEEAVYKISLKYIKTPNFDDTLSDPSDPTSEPVSEVNVKSFIKIYVDSLGIGKDLTTGNLINFLYSNTNEILPASLTIYTDASTTVGTLVNNDKILTIDVDDIELEEQV